MIGRPRQWSGILALCVATGAAAGPTFVVGVENQDYLPAFTYEQGAYKGFARELFDAFARDRGYVFEYRALPVPRLYASFFGGQLDFKFPDNPNWKKDQRAGKTILYSDPVFVTVDGVSVVPEKKEATPADIRTLGTMAGFTPWAWIDRIKANQVSLSENTHFDGLIRQALAGRVDGVYASVAVMNYQLDHVLKKPGALTFNPRLPYSRDNYHLSTFKHGEVLREFNAWLKQNRASVEAMKKRHGVEKGVMVE